MDKAEVLKVLEPFVRKVAIDKPEWGDWMQYTVSLRDLRAARDLHARLSAEAEEDEVEAIKSEAWQDIGELFGCPPGFRIPDYAKHVRQVLGRYGALKRVAQAAQDYFAEHQEDGEGVPQPQLREMLAALDWYEALEKEHPSPEPKLCVHGARPGECLQSLSRGCPTSTPPEPVEQGAAREAQDFSRITLRNNLGTILSDWRDAHPSTLLDKIMDAIPVVDRAALASRSVPVSTPASDKEAL